MPINIDELLSELEGAEKTAEDSFIEGVTKSEEKVAEATETEEKVAEEVKEDVAEETEEKVAESTESEEITESEEKVAESTESEEEVIEATKTDAEKDKEDVQRAMDMGRIAAHTFYSELVALGIMPPTNKDMAVPPISSVSLPSESPVTVAADAAYQEAAGHDAYDVRRQSKQITKKASKITPGVLQELYNKIYPED